jgi:hypothetical protein
MKINLAINLFFSEANYRRFNSYADMSPLKAGKMQDNSCSGKALPFSDSIKSVNATVFLYFPGGRK